MRLYSALILSQPEVFLVFHKSNRATKTGADASHYTFHNPIRFFNSTLSDNFSPRSEWKIKRKTKITRVLPICVTCLSTSAILWRQNVFINCVIGAIDVLHERNEKRKKSNKTKLVCSQFFFHSIGAAMNLSCPKQGKQIYFNCYEYFKNSINNSRNQSVENFYRFDSIAIDQNQSDKFEWNFWFREIIFIWHFDDPQLILIFVFFSD